MKPLSILFCILSVLPFTGRAQQNPYDLAFPALANNTDINMSSFMGKKVIILEFDASNPDRRQMLALDTLYIGNMDKLAVLAVPVTDFGAGLSEDSLKNILAGTLGLHYPIASTSKAGKANGLLQHPMMQWLTHKEHNGHFDDDIDRAGEVFFLGENGKLFARLRDGLPPTGILVKKLLARQVTNN